MRPIAATTSTIRTHRPQRRLNWVSKTDVVRYLRCPYAFWQIDSGALAPEAAIDALGERLIEDGVAFEGTVTAEARPLPPGVDLADAFVTEARVYGLPRLENHQLELHGIPDAVDAARGRLMPVEIKSHREVRCTDELELAFYWRLLEPYRTIDPCEPYGRLTFAATTPRSRSRSG